MERMAPKTTYLGAGIGLVLFAIIGLLPGSLLGGAMGLNIVGVLFGYPVTASLLSRIIVAASMLPHHYLLHHSHHEAHRVLRSREPAWNPT